MIPHDPLQQLRDLDGSSPQFLEQLSDFFHGSIYRDSFPDLLESDGLAWLVEFLNSVLLGIFNHANPTFRESLHQLKHICSANGVLPKSCTLSESLFGCAYEGTFNGSKVRIRRVRVRRGEDLQKAREVFHQATIISKYLSHPNIVPLLGVTMDPLELVSDWMPGGDLTTYIIGNGDTNKLSLLSDVAEGLNYLHSCDVVHGNLNGSSVLVDSTGHARITDIGLPMATQDLGSIRDPAECHDVRWIAPEILDGRGPHSKESDIFSFAGVTIEVFTGAVPFRDKSPHAAILAITSGERPPRPIDQVVTADLWELIQRCWNGEAHLRPSALRISSGFGVPAWKRVAELPLASEKQISLIADIFSDRDETKVVEHLHGDDARSFIELMDKVLDELEPRLRSVCLGSLCKICGRQALLPRSVQLPSCYNQADEPLYSGGFAQVWKGEYQGGEVAVKVLKACQTSDFEKITRGFCKEVMVWKTLRHPNVLPLLGVTMGNRQFAMISEWMVHGNINEFVEAQMDANRWELLADVARGLIYIHCEGIVHGDLKGDNILIDKHGRACLADFGLVTIVSNPAHSTASLSSTIAGTTRWMSPELLDPDSPDSQGNRPTKHSDCYALGMVIFEVLSGEPPFARYSSPMVIHKVIRGDHPERPTGAWFTDDLWGTLKQCWSRQSEDRPPIGTVLECLGRVSVATAAGDFILEHLLRRSFSYHELLFLLKTILSTRGSTYALHCLRVDDAQVFIDILDEGLDGLRSLPDLRKKCLQSLHEMCVHHTLIPTALKIELRDCPTDAIRYRGGTADVLKQNHQGQEVAVKTLRTSTSADARVLVNRFCKEFLLWNNLRHPNVLQLIGVIMTDAEFTMVSEWMPNGNISGFVKEHRDANRFELLGDVAKGLIYIHDQGMIHGDLKGRNILIDQTHHARIADFGLTILSDSTISNLHTQGSTIRWMSPELFTPEVGHYNPTKHSDCYALGMVVYEVLSLRVPFYQYQDFAISGKVIQGDRPERPEGVEGTWFTDSVWEVLKRCWIPEPQNRPGVEDVSQCLDQISLSWTGPPEQYDAAVKNANMEHSLSQTMSSPFARRPDGENFIGIDDNVPNIGLQQDKPLYPGPVDRDPLNSGDELPEVAMGPEVGNDDEAKAERIIRQQGWGSRLPIVMSASGPTISASVWLNEVAEWDGVSPHIQQVLVAAFGAGDYLDCIKDLQARGIEPLSYINSLDKVIDSLPVGSDLRRRCLRALRKTCGIHGVLPDSHTIAFSLSKPGPKAYASGGFSDVWRVTDAMDPNRTFAVKCLRVSPQDPVDKVNKRYCKEVIVGKRAIHPNTLHIEGVAPQLLEFCMVSEWMPDGDILRYATRHPGANRLELLIGVTRGLDYLHENEIVHGDLKSPNILVDPEGNPRLHDFGLSSITRDTDSVNASTPNHGCTVRHCAPELLDIGVVRTEKRKRTYKSDVYSLSMVTVELATGKMPFPELTDPDVIVVISKGKRPQKPRRFDAMGITPAVWQIAQRCWRERAKERPEVKVVLRDLEKIANPDSERAQSGFEQKLRDIFN